MSPDTWRALQESYQLGELTMPCCDGAAVPKLSSNGNPFFAHAGGACGSSPESLWHVQAKESVRDAARSLGFMAELERPGGSGRQRWRADVWVTAPGGPIAIECQHSYQHLRDYLSRQERYAAAGARCLWLVMQRQYHTLLQSTMKKRFVEEFGRTWPDGQRACLRELPALMLMTDPEPVVSGPSLHAPVVCILEAFASGRLLWRDGQWLISTAGSGPT